ncbi:hypothetical protein BJV78DRAFT_1217557 [Lactifluus subvellereus]|nr:hypothetical protein BJV78DRAFT_1217557 [Lactifluus subvellereus]
MLVNEDASPPEKRQKLDLHEIVRKGEPTGPVLSRLDLIPLEILAEILSYVNSPQDVLSVARCNKHLRATLLNPSNRMIWRRARRHCIVPGLPPPLPGWSESAYAAFIFDAGTCYICGVSTKRMFYSFVARVRICGKHDCHKKLFEDHMALGHARPADPETKSHFLRKRLRYLDIPVTPLPGSSYLYCLRSDLIKTTEEYNQIIARGQSQDDYLQLFRTDIRRQRQVLEHAKVLYRWSDQWRRRYRMTKKSNIAFTRELAVEVGWNLQDLLDNPTYRSLHRSRNTCLETISKSDVHLLLTKIDAEILSQVENKERRQKTHAQQIRRADIARHRDRLVEGKNHLVVPILAEFRGFPIIKALQDREDASPFLYDTTRSPTAKQAKTPRALEFELKHSKLIGGMINNDLKKWTDTALGAFDAMIGQPNWKCASTRVLHPAERVTARFICILCRKTPKYATIESLDFRGACAHQCAGHPKKAVAKWKWKADHFVPDQKAIDVLSQALALAGLRAEHRETKVNIGLIGARFLCKSCDSPIVMDFQRLAGHCHRHDSMQVALVSMAEAHALWAEHPYDAGSFASYTSRTNKAEEMRQSKTFGCRHCQHRNVNPETAQPLRNTGDHVERRFAFNGLVSHAKEKCASSLFLP